jgi:hypothetical protein
MSKGMEKQNAIEYHINKLRSWYSSSILSSSEESIRVILYFYCKFNFFFIFFQLDKGTKYLIDQGLSKQVAIDIYLNGLKAQLNSLQDKTGENVQQINVQFLSAKINIKISFRIDQVHLLKELIYQLFRSPALLVLLAEKLVQLTL